MLIPNSQLELIKTSYPAGMETSYFRHEDGEHIVIRQLVTADWGEEVVIPIKDLQDINL